MYGVCAPIAGEDNRPPDDVRRTVRGCISSRPRSVEIDGHGHSHGHSHGHGLDDAISI